MKNIDLMIFDLDGTLVDSKQDIANAVNHTLRELGFKEKDPALIVTYVGTGAEDLIKKSIDEKEGYSLDEALSILSKYYKKHSLDNTRLYPGVRDILDHFKDKRMALITNRKLEFAVKTLKGLDIYDHFEDISGGDDLGCMKPSSCPLEKAMRKFNIDRKRSMMIGDMNIDILAGKEAGMATCAVTYGLGKIEDIKQAGPDHMIDDILKLKELIK